MNLIMYDYRTRPYRGGRAPMFLRSLAQFLPSTYSITMYRCLLLSKLQYIETTKELSMLGKHLLNLVECSNHIPLKSFTTIF